MVQYTEVSTTKEWECYNYYRKLQCLPYHKHYLQLQFSHNNVTSKRYMFLFPKINEAIWKQKTDSFSLLFKFFNVELQIYLSGNNNTNKVHKCLLFKITAVYKMPWQITKLFHDSYLKFYVHLAFSSS